MGMMGLLSSSTIRVLLAGGDKSTQQQDIRAAIALGPTMWPSNSARQKKWQPIWTPPPIV